MDMSQHPAETTIDTHHAADSNGPAAVLLAIVALTLAGLGGAFWMFGAIGITLPMVAITPVIYVILVMLTAGK